MHAYEADTTASGASPEWNDAAFRKGFPQRGRIGLHCANSRLNSGNGAVQQWQDRRFSLQPEDSMLNALQFATARAAQPAAPCASRSVAHMSGLSGRR
jgi:hypothetical protein